MSERNLTSATGGENRVRAGASAWLTGVLLTLAAAVAGHLLYSAYCAFTNFKFTIFDYGVYTNMIWNAAHGEPFRVLVDRSYLSTHLSFTLALIGPLYRIWDHPFLLSLVQWLAMVGGAVILWGACRRNRVLPEAAAAVVFFFTAYRLTQAAMLSEFHGVSMYYLLLPWLYYCLSFRKNLAWLPLILILGVREEAFLITLPMLLYFAVRDRWKTGYVLAGLAVLYGVVAIFLLYPAINGWSVFARRKSVIPTSILEMFDPVKGSRRLQALGWVLTPALVFLHRKFIPALLFPLPVLLASLLSRFATQQSLGSHYGGPAAVCLAIGLAETLVLRRRALGDDMPRREIRDLWLRTALLFLVVIVAHRISGFVWLGGKNYETYRRPNIQGRAALQVAAMIPRDGVLLTRRGLAGLCANRRDILTIREYRAERHRVDHIFVRLSDNMPLETPALALLQQSEVGVLFFDGEFLILSRAADPAGNAAFLANHNLGPIRLAFTAWNGGTTRKTADGVWVRHWEGDGSRAPIVVSHSGSRMLNPGLYEAVFTYRAGAPRRQVRGYWGWFSVHPQGRDVEWARADIRPEAAVGRSWQEERLRFILPESAMVEVRVTGGDAPLWLREARFIPLPAPSPESEDRASPVL